MCMENFELRLSVVRCANPFSWWETNRRLRTGGNGKCGKIYMRITAPDYLREKRYIRARTVFQRCIEFNVFVLVFFSSGLRFTFSIVFKHIYSFYTST